MSSAISSTSVLEAMRAGARWLASHQREDGRFGDEEDINGYYKCAYSLRVAGEPAASGRCLDRIVSRYMTSDGDFMNDTADPGHRTVGNYTARFCQIYPNFWILRAACVLNRFDVADKVFSFLLTCQDEASGGVYYQVNRESGLFESNATACVCVSGLLRGRLDIAKKAADALLRWKGLQKDAERFYIRWNPGDGLRTAEFDEADKKFFVVDSTQAAQLYWLVGLPMAALAKLYQVVGERKYLECSIALYDFLMSCNPDVFGSPPIGKLGWGSAILYRITGDTRYLETNRKITRYYLDTQHKDGYWLAPAYKTVEEQPLKQTTDWTGEFCAWLSDYQAELGAS